MDDNQNKELDLIAQTIFDKKGFNILAIDVRNVCSMTDFFVIAEGNVDRHIQSINKAICEQLSKAGLKPLHVEGQKTGDWIVIDFGQIVVHLFTSDLREHYAIETLWKEGNVVDLHINLVSSSK